MSLPLEIKTSNEDQSRAWSEEAVSRKQAYDECPAYTKAERVSQRPGICSIENGDQVFFRPADSTSIHHALQIALENEPHYKRAAEISPQTSGLLPRRR